MAFSNLKFALRHCAEPWSALKVACITAYNSRPWLRTVLRPLLRGFCDRTGTIWFRSRSVYSPQLHNYGIRLESIHADHQTFFEMASRDAYALRELRIPRVVVDGGGNIGHFALSASALWPEADILIFEPSEENLAALRRHLDRNRVRAVVHAECLAREPGFATFYIREANRCSLSSDTPFVREVHVPTVRLSDRLRDIEGPVLIKLDVEGAELQIIEDVLSSDFRIPLVVVGELHDFRRTLGPLQQLCDRRDWQVSVLAEEGECLLFRCEPRRSAT